MKILHVYYKRNFRELWYGMYLCILKFSAFFAKNMNYRILIYSMALLFTGVLHSQGLKKPSYKNMTISPATAKVGDIAELTITMKPAAGMHLYSEKSTCPEGEGARITELTFTGTGFTTSGKFFGIGDEMKPDELGELNGFKCNTGVFKDLGTYKQKVKITGTNVSITCNYSGQMCNDNGCIGISEVINLSTKITVTGAVAPAEKPAEEPKPTSLDTSRNIDTSSESSVKPVLNGEVHSYKVKSASEVGTCKELKYTGNVGAAKNETKNKGLGLVFWLAFTSGLVALLTPCVFPMIPMTVAFFLKNKDRKKSMRDGLIFALSIIGIYVVIGTIVSKLVGPDAANWLSTHWIPNIFFFAIFIVFAASFFGAFELVLPASWVNAMDKRADKGGFAGPFFMALTIALVSFSCTGPIVGTVLVESAKGGLITPIIAMFGFSLAFALPFGLLVMFPSYLQSMPKSGGWLNSVKVVLGFVELAFALKFLSTADQTYHWRLLDREIYLAFWIVIFALLAIYLMGKLKFSHDSDIPYLSVPRLMLVIITWTFVVYLIPGLWGAPLKALAGYLPPMHTQDFKILSNGESSVGDKESCGIPKYEGQLHLPHGLKGYYDYEQALACSKEQKKPLFIDFTGHGCVNCRRMEEKVWSDPAVLKILKNDYIVVSLYVDDKKIKLPAEEQFTGRYSGRLIKNLGEKNTEIQACYFNSNSQPMYVLMNGDQELLQHPGSAETFEYNPEKFAKFLQNGLSEFKSKATL